MNVYIQYINILLLNLRIIITLGTTNLLAYIVVFHNNELERKNKNKNNNKQKERKKTTMNKKVNFFLLTSSDNSFTYKNMSPLLYV